MPFTKAEKKEKIGLLVVYRTALNNEESGVEARKLWKLLFIPCHMFIVSLRRAVVVATVADCMIRKRVIWYWRDFPKDHDCLFCLFEVY